MEKKEKNADELYFKESETEENEDLEKELKDSLRIVWFGGYSKKSVLLYVKIQKRSKEQMRSNMEQQVEDLLKEKNRANQEAEFLRQQIKNTEQELKEKEKKLAIVQEDFDKLHQKAESYSTDNQGKEESFRKLREENETYRQIESKLRSELKEKDRLLQEKEMLDPVRSFGFQNQEKYEEAIAGKEDEIHQLKKKLADIREDLETQENKNRQMEIEKNMLGQEREILHKQLFELTTKQDEQDQLRQENDSLYQRIDEMEQEKDSLERKLNISSERIEKMKIQDAETMRKQQELKNDYLDIQNKFDQMYQQSNALRSQIKQMEQERKAMDEVLGKYQKQEKELVLLKNSNQSYIAEISEMEKSVRFIFDQMNEQMQEFLKLSQKYEEGKSQIQNLIREKTQMQLKNVELMGMFGHMEADGPASGEALKTAETDQEADFIDSMDLTESVWREETGKRNVGFESNLFSIADMKQRSVSMTGELRERQKKNFGGDGGAI